MSKNKNGTENEIVILLLPFNRFLWSNEHKMKMGDKRVGGGSQEKIVRFSSLCDILHGNGR